MIQQMTLKAKIVKANSFNDIVVHSTLVQPL